jgi:hypothetical protein
VQGVQAVALADGDEAEEDSGGVAAGEYAAAVEVATRCASQSGILSSLGKRNSVVKITAKKLPVSISYGTYQAKSQEFLITPLADGVGKFQGLMSGKTFPYGALSYLELLTECILQEPPADQGATQL